MGGWFRKEIKSVDDLNGLKIRIGGFAGQVLAKLGVVPQQIAGGDIYPALEKGTHRCRRVGRPLRRREARLPEGRAVLLLSRLVGRRRACSTTMVNIEKWNELPKNYKAIVRDRVRDTPNDWMTAKYDASNPAALKRLVAAGAQLRPFPQAVMEACYKAANEALRRDRRDQPGVQEDLRQHDRLPRRRNICGGRSRNTPTTPS